MKLYFKSSVGMTNEVGMQQVVERNKCKMMAKIRKKKEPHCSSSLVSSSPPMGCQFLVHFLKSRNRKAS